MLNQDIASKHRVERRLPRPDYYADLSNAAYLSLTYVPSSDQSVELGADLAERLFPRSRGGTRGRPVDAMGRQRLLLAIVAEVLHAAKKARNRWVYRSLTSTSFTEAPYGYRQFKTVMKSMVAQAFLRTIRGSFNRFIFGDKLLHGFGYATRWQATEEFFAICESYGITSSNVELHFRCPLPPHPLVLKKSSSRSGHLKVKGKAIRFPQTQRSQELEAEVRELNQKLSQHELENAGFYGYRRIFAQGDNPNTYRWDKGGRLYAVGEDNYQTTKRELRALITIDGEPCVEVDIRASQLTILYLLLDQWFDRTSDPYTVEGLPRMVVKKWIVMALGAGGFPRRWSPEAGKDYREEFFGKSIGKDYPMKKVEQAILERHPAIRKLPTSTVTCFDLQFRESEVIVSTMLTLLRKFGVPSFSIHDSLLVKARDALDASRVLRNEYETFITIEPYLKVTASEAVWKAFPNLSRIADENYVT